MFNNLKKIVFFNSFYHYDDYNLSFFHSEVHTFSKLHSVNKMPAFFLRTGINDGKANPWG